jgi:hypothetical protein
MGKSEASSHIRIKYFQKEEKGEEEYKSLLLQRECQ